MRVQCTSLPKAGWKLLLAVPSCISLPRAVTILLYRQLCVDENSYTSCSVGLVWPKSSYFVVVLLEMGRGCVSLCTSAAHPGRMFLWQQITCDQLVLTCTGWPNGKNLASTCVQISARPKSTQVVASRCKSTQVGGQTKRKLNASPILASTWVRLARA